MKKKYLFLFILVLTACTDNKTPKNTGVTKTKANITHGSKVSDVVKLNYKGKVKKVTESRYYTAIRNSHEWKNLEEKPFMVVITQFDSSGFIRREDYTDYFSGERSEEKYELYEYKDNILTARHTYENKFKSMSAIIEWIGPLSYEEKKYIFYREDKSLSTLRSHKRYELSTNYHIKKIETIDKENDSLRTITTIDYDTLNGITKYNRLDITHQVLQKDNIGNPTLVLLHFEEEDSYSIYKLAYEYY